MQYALLVYAPAEDTDRATRPIPGSLAALLGRPDVAAGPGCTLRSRRRRCATTTDGCC